MNPAHTIFCRPRSLMLASLSLALACTSFQAPASAQGLRSAVEQALSLPYAAPELTGLDHWVNSAPLRLQDLKGKVVLIDFWTYSCINCLRTLPHLIDWQHKYHDKGFVVIGIHAPEFEFEKDPENVRHAIARFHIPYPVAQDNQLITWNAFNNRYWPAHYLIDQHGKVVYSHFGEGNYEHTENTIRHLLGITESMSATPDDDRFDRHQTPETYLGYRRANSYDGPVSPAPDHETSYRATRPLAPHTWTLDGAWTMNAEYLSSGPHSALQLSFSARKVFLVLGTNDGKAHRVSVTLNGKPLADNAGSDSKNGFVTVDRHRLYELVDQHRFASGVLQIESDDAGVQAYAFTFGS
jgi:thiol-disulfide isomerase/thioredoxin